MPVFLKPQRLMTLFHTGMKHPRNLLFNCWPLWEFLYLPTARKVMFSEACIILLGGGCMMSLPVWSHVPSRGMSASRAEWVPQVVTSSGGNCSGRYASYWSAFLFIKLLYFLNCPNGTKLRACNKWNVWGRISSMLLALMISKSQENMDWY